MRRDYTVAEYLDRFERLQAARPGVAITTDFIVGFPGETGEDFEASLRLLERARFEQSFSFVFSPRPHTVANLRLGSAPEWQEVPREVGVERLERLLQAQRRIAAAHHASQLGRVVEVLVEGASDEPGERVGRTPENRVVHFAATDGEAPAGALVAVRVLRAGTSSLSGVVV
jgi:tRNA-2-methylthio-N6-dimethylallyladenosine synthase